MATWTPTGTRSMRASQSTTETAPVNPTDGVNLSEVSTILCVMHAPGGQTFTGTGTMLAYVYIVDTGWVRAPAADYDMGDANGLADVALPIFTVASPRSYFMLVPSSIGVSSGATITTDYIAVSRSGKQL